MLLPLAVEAISLPLNATEASSIPGFIPHAVAAASERSLFTIVWSCVATLFACAWVAVHPDISGLDDDGIDRFFHRVKLLIWVLISPEAILVWAWRQHRGAQALRYMFNRPDGEAYLEHWNLVHAHFLQMGGFVICTDRDDDQTLSIARPEQFHELVKDKIIDFPKKLKPLDISDRSKGDGLTYFVAITQLAWFTTQCIGRTVAGLSITLFELVSISFAPITVIVYILWWQKPQNAQSPIVLLRNRPQSVTSDGPTNTYATRPDEKKQTIGENLLPFPVSLFEGAIRTFEDMLGTTSRSQSVPEQSRRLPPFYAYPHEHNAENIPITPLIMGSLMGSIFGIIHVIGWNFTFATRLEKILWRCSASLIVVVPLLTVLIIFTTRKLLHPKVSEHTPPKYQEWWLRILRVTFALLAAMLTLSYIAARIVLLVVMCTSLRALPLSQQQDIKWVTDIPHIL